MRGIQASLLATLLLTAVSMADDSATSAPRIEWVEDLSAAMELSAQDGRPVIAYFTFDACVWCKRLEKACFDDPDVVKLSRKFIWVTVNRDETPEPPQRLNVFAYPSLLILGREEENIYRFQSYQEPDEFIGNLQTGLKRYSLYRQDKPWNLPPTRPARIISAGAIGTLPAPTDAVPGGLTVLGESIWLAQGELFRLDAETGQVTAKFPLPKSVGDLCTDGRQIFAVTYGWTAGQPIYVIDPSSGEVVREIITKSNRKNRSHGAKGIAYRDGRLHVLSGMVGKVSAIDLESGDIWEETQLDGNWLSGLSFHGGKWITGGRTHLWEFDVETGEVVRKTDVHYPVRNVASHGAEILLMEQPVFGFGTRHQRIQVWPQETLVYRWAPIRLPQQWEFTAPLIAPEQRDHEPSRAQKDPTVVFHDGRWHVFMTVKLPGRSAIEYCSFAKWEDAQAAPRTLLPISKSDYFCAPQVFFFEPHQKWYLVYQMGVPGQKKMWVAYSTTETIDDATSWTAARPLLDGGPSDPRQVGGLDYWIICDDERAYLFLTSLNGKMWRLWTKLEDFPHGMDHCQLALQAKIFEASHTYKLKGQQRYLTIIEENGQRYYKAYIADRLDGEWTPLADSRQNPFAAASNIRPAKGVPTWTDNVSHGELLRDGNDQTLTIDPDNLRFVFQGMLEEHKSGKGYGAFQWRIGMLTPVTAD